MSEGTSRGEILARFEHAENNVAAVHLAMFHYYAGVYSLEEALMLAINALAEQNEKLIQQSLFAPRPIIIVKPPDS